MWLLEHEHPLLDLNVFIVFCLLYRNDTLWDEEVFDDFVIDFDVWESEGDVMSDFELLSSSE